MKNTVKNSAKVLAMLLMMLFIFQGCLKIGEYYLGLNLQPALFEQENLHGLNIYGVLKTGPGLDTTNHFFEVQQMLSIREVYDSLIVTNANIALSRDSAGHVLHYQLDHLYDGRYFDESIQTAPGDVWTLSCCADTFVISASCRIPKQPELDGLPKIGANGLLHFSVLADSTAFMHQVYVFYGEKVYVEKQQAPVGSGNVFSIKLDSLLHGNLILYVFAYDENLARYQTSSNTFFKPNAYRPPFTTVEGGYGTFGAVSSSRFEISR